MKISRATLIIFFIFILGIVFTWYWEFSPAKEARLTPTPTESPKLLSGWTTSDLIGIDVISEDGINIQLRKNSDNYWAYSSLENKQPDQGKVYQLSSSLLNLSASNTTNSDITIDALGLTNPKMIITVQHINGTKIIINVGNITPTESGYYIQIDTDSPVVSGKYSIDAIIDLIQNDNLTLITPTPPSSASINE